MISELDPVALNVDRPDAGLARGDIGAVVHVHAGDAAYEVEFVTVAGGTIAGVTLEADEVRPVT